MKAPDFRYLRPASLAEAAAALDRFGDDAMILAGGQSLMAMHNLRVARAEVLVDINRVPGLSGIRDAGGHLEVGSLTRHAELEASPLVHAHLPLLAAALPHVAHPAVRSRGTLGGSLALADPAAELPACCLALGATLVVAGVRGERRVAAEDFFLGLYETALGPGELIAAVHLPKAEASSVHRFAEVARRRGDFALAGAALVADDDGGTLRAPRLAVFGVDERPLLARHTMRLLEGERAAAVDADALRAALARDASPPPDPACPPAYRRHALWVLLRRMLDAPPGAAA